MSSRTLKLEINLSVLEDLGLRLYSSAPAVLSEIVANAWDADAERVDISIDFGGQTITIDDDGHGMSFEEARSRYLTVGYRRRQSQPGPTAKHRRQVMGRKGIGKLAPLAIADEVEIETRKDGRCLRFNLDVEKIKDDIRHSRTHEPEILADEECQEPDGTKITLRKLKSRVQSAVAPLRKRLALRFSVIGQPNNFIVSVNGSPICPDDVDYYKRIEFAWLYDLPANSPERTKFSTAANLDDRSPTFDGSEFGLPSNMSFRGWLATVKTPRDLEDNGESFGRVAVYMRGKVAHENALQLVGDDHLFTKYLVGELHADFLDSDAEEDIATTSRQALLESDSRVQAIRKFLKSELKFIGNVWTEKRIGVDAIKVAEIPAVRQYLEGLGPNPRKVATKFLGKIWSVRAHIENKQELVKAGILFCENVRIQEAIQKLESVDAVTLLVMAEAFDFVSVMEAAQYHELLRARLHVIEAFKKIATNDEKEKTLQTYIASHLWLLNPSWDVVPTTGAVHVEASLGQLAKKLMGEGSADEKAKRLDIFYSKTANTHVIIELKKYDAVPLKGRLLDQVGSYRREVRKILDSSGRVNDAIEVYVLLGSHPSKTPDEKQIATKQFAEENAHIVLYDELIDNAQSMHKGYLSARGEVNALKTILASIDSDVTINNL